VTVLTQIKTPDGRPKMTAKQFMMLGEDPPGIRLELIHGEIGVSPSPSFSHSYADTQLRIILGNHIKQNDLGALVGDVDTFFGDYNVRRPDILFVAKSRLHLIKGHGVPIPPDLCVEILSPSSVTIDQTDKFELYAAHHVPNYWLVDPESHSFKAYRLEAGAYALAASGQDNDAVHASPFDNLPIPLGQLWCPTA
jgi:Uma2 family endonuclease